MSQDNLVENASVLNYSSYLKVNDLLSLQHPSLAHDEMLFIIVHQVYELWFKEILHELDHVCLLMRQEDSGPILKTLCRVNSILKLLVMQFDILETMTPTEFLTFRNRLGTSSGFESCQFRELEFLLGIKAHFHKVMPFFKDNIQAQRRLEIRFMQPTLWDAFLQHLSHKKYPISETLLTRDVAQPILPSTDIQKILTDIYEEDAILRQVCEQLFEIDESLLKWRYHHVLMAQRTIGIKVGTGGSDGVKYLMHTLSKRAFPDLWDFRNAI